MGHDAPRTGFVNLRINGDYWGLYNVVEPIDEAYFARRDAQYPQGGRLFKAVRKHGERADFERGRDLSLAFENKSDEPQRYDDLEALVEALQDTALSADAWGEHIDPIFSLATYIDRMVWVSLTQNGDAVAQNFFLYNAPRDGHDHWYLLPWDSNLAFGADWKNDNRVRPLGEGLYIEGGNLVARRLVQIAELRARYIERYTAVLDEVLNKDVALDILRARVGAVSRDLELDQVRWKREVAPRQAFDAIEEFVVTRPAFIDEGLERLDAKYAEAGVPELPDDDDEEIEESEELDEIHDVGAPDAGESEEIDDA
jgi:spore coat protein CotH